MIASVDLSKQSTLYCIVMQMRQLLKKVAWRPLSHYQALYEEQNLTKEKMREMKNDVFLFFTKKNFLLLQHKESLWPQVTL